MDNEFRFYAILLLFGKNSPYLERYSIYNIDVLRQYKELRFIEVSLIGNQNRYDTIRTLYLNNSQSIIVNRCYSFNKIGTQISFIDKQYHFNVSDLIFSKEEHDQKSEKWSTIVDNKIEYLGLLLHSIYFKEICEMPLFIHTFSNISTLLIGEELIWQKE